jgi:hypothetical protein
MCSGLRVGQYAAFLRFVNFVIMTWYMPTGPIDKNGEMNGTAVVVVAVVHSILRSAGEWAKSFELVI